MKGLDANTQKYELAEIDHNVVLFTNMRLDRDTVPEGIFCYDVRDSDNLDGSMAQIKPFVLVNHWGTILSKTPFPLDESGSYYPEDWGYLGEDMSLSEFRKETAEQLEARLEPAIRRRNDHAAMNILPLEGEVMRHEQFYFMGWREESTPQPDLYHVPCKF